MSVGATTAKDHAWRIEANLFDTGRVAERQKYISHPSTVPFTRSFVIVTTPRTRPPEAAAMAAAGVKDGESAEDSGASAVVDV